MDTSSGSVADRTRLTDCQCAPTSVNIPQSAEMAIEVPREAFWKEDLETAGLLESSSLLFSHAKCRVLGLELTRPGGGPRDIGNCRGLWRRRWRLYECCERSS